MNKTRIDYTKLADIKDDQLRDYQIDNKNKIYHILENKRSVMLQMPTGTGKTRLFASIVKDIHNWSIENKQPVRTLILAHREELIEQICTNVGYRYNIAHGVIKSKHYEQAFYPTQVASVQTLIRRLGDWKNKSFDLIIIDEAHHALAESYVKICNAFPYAKLLGVTATPYRLNGAGFKSLFDDIIVSYPVKRFIENGYLSDYSYYSIKPESHIQQLINNISEFDFDGDYAERALLRIFDKPKIRANIVNTYKKYADGKKGIVYTINQTHNKEVCAAFQDIGVIAEAIDSNTNPEERKRLVNEFKKGKIDILCNVNIFSEGFDCPDVEFIQLARPTKSLSMFLQQIGRGLRTAENKQKAIFLDNVGLYNRFGLPSARRMWQKHFDGQELTDTELRGYTTANDSSTIHFLDEYEEGNETISLIHSSENEIQQHNDIQQTYIINNDMITDTTTDLSIEEIDKDIAVFERYDLPIPDTLIVKKRNLEQDMAIAQLPDKIKQLAQPLFDGIEQALTFTITYTPDGGIAIDKNSLQKKQTTPTISNSNIADGSKLSVTFPNGTIIRGAKTKDTMIKVIQTIGVAKVAELELECCGIPLIDKKRSKNTAYADSQIEIEPGFYLMTLPSNRVTKFKIEQISQHLKLGLMVEEV